MMFMVNEKKRVSDGKKEHLRFLTVTLVTHINNALYFRYGRKEFYHIYFGTPVEETCTIT